jgi:hypothetical protein
MTDEITTKGFFKKYRKFGTIILQYSIVAVLLVGSYYLGRLQKTYEYEMVAETNEEPIVRSIKKDSINLAVDEGNNLIIIDNSTGKYTIYQDSIGYKIFKLYAGTIWRED